MAAHYSKNMENTIAKECFKCKGTCYVKGNQAQTFANARKMFGCLPNSCVDAEGGNPACPAVKGLI